MTNCSQSRTAPLKRMHSTGTKKGPSPISTKGWKYPRWNPDRTKTMTRGTHSTHCPLCHCTLSVGQPSPAHTYSHLQHAGRAEQPLLQPRCHLLLQAEEERCASITAEQNTIQKSSLPPPFSKGTLNNSDMVAEPPSFVACSFGSTKNTAPQIPSGLLRWFIS